MSDLRKMIRKAILKDAKVGQYHYEVFTNYDKSQTRRTVRADNETDAFRKAINRFGDTITAIRHWINKKYFVQDENGNVVERCKRAAMCNERAG